MSARIAPPSAAFPGRVEPGMVLGAYEILFCVARGGMANVWAAQHRQERGSGRLVALKTALPELCEPEFETMFHEEARVASRIHHPHVCEFIELVEQGSVRALCMEWVDGCTLGALIGDATNLPREQPVLDCRIAAQIVAQAACGLHAAHELRDEAGAPVHLVHRDVSPQNILIARSGRIKIADFGVAKACGTSREATAVGRIKGKISYMSPEQAQGKTLDRRSDIFALGVVLYLATVGVHPFRRAGDTREQQYLRLLVGEMSAPSTVVRGYPPELESIVLRALAAEPSERFSTADEMRAALLGWLGRSGPEVSEQHVAQVVMQRAGELLEERAQRIRICLRASQFAELAAADPRLGAETTFIPTISPAAEASATFKTGQSPRARTWLTAVAAAGLGLMAGQVSFSGPVHTPVPEAAAPMSSVPGPMLLEPLDSTEPPKTEPKQARPADETRAAKKARRARAREQTSRAKSTRALAPKSADRALGAPAQPKRDPWSRARQQESSASARDKARELRPRRITQ